MAEIICSLKKRGSSGGTISYIFYKTTKSGSNISIAKGVDNKAIVLAVYGSDGGTVYIQYSDDGSSYTTYASYGCAGAISRSYELDFTVHPYWRIYNPSVTTNWPTSWGAIVTLV